MNKFNMELVAANIEAANKALMSNEKKVYEYHVLDDNGEVVKTVNSYAKYWSISKRQARQSNQIYYVLNLVITNSKGFPINIDIRLSDEQATSINYHADNFLSKIKVGAKVEQYLQTRFIYGINTNGKWFVMACINIADKVRLCTYLSPTYRDILFDSYEKNNPFDIIIDRKLDEESIQPDDIQTL